MKPAQIPLEDECINVYDPAEKKLIGTYKNYREASRVLGLLTKNLRQAVCNKTRRFSPFLNKEVALRLANKNKLK